MLCMWSTCTCLKQCSHTLWLSNLDQVDSTERAKVFIWRNVGPTRRVTQSPQKGDPARQVTLLEEPTFCFSCNKMPCFERKCTKSWLAQGSSTGGWCFLAGWDNFSPFKQGLSMKSSLQFYSLESNWLKRSFINKGSAWWSGQCVRLVIQRSQVRVPLWWLAGFVLGRPSSHPQPPL